MDRAARHQAEGVWITCERISESFYFYNNNQTTQCTCFHFAQILLHPGAFNGMYWATAGRRLTEKETKAADASGCQGTPNGIVPTWEIPIIYRRWENVTRSGRTAVAAGWFGSLSARFISPSPVR
ncbi:MAG: hypothetical protein ABSF26_02710 [Thermoguttaceae bacterium]|jgi:hypothetical protein